MKVYKIYINIILFALLAIYASSCKKDQGNYNYEPINEVKITQVDSAYTIGIGTKLLINPVLNFTMDGKGDSSNYSYEWYYFSNGLKKSISNNKNINMLLPFAPGISYIYYSVNDKSTGVSWFKKIQVNIEATIAKGWLFLCDVNGTARLDMAIPKTVPTADNWGTVAFNPVINDVLRYAGSPLALKGKPLNVNNQLYITTDALTTTVTENTFAWDESKLIKYSLDGASKYPADYGVDFASEGLNTQMFYKTGKIFISGAWFDHVDGEAQAFYAAPYIEGYTGLFTALVCFDNSRKRFFNFVSALPTNTFQAFANPTTNAKFDYNIGMDLIYMQATYRRTGTQSGSVYSLLKDPGTSKYYIAGIGVVTYPATFTQDFYGLVNDSNISKAEHYTFSSNYSVLYYSIGSILYEYNYLSATTRTVGDYGNEKIVFLKNNHFNQTTYATTRYSNLMVATTDASLPDATCGTVYQYYTPELSGGALKLVQTMKGTGKVVSLTYHTISSFN